MGRIPVIRPRTKEPKPSSPIRQYPSDGKISYPVTSTDMPINPGKDFTKTPSTKPSMIYKKPSPKTIQEQYIHKSDITPWGKRTSYYIKHEPRPRLLSRVRSNICPICGRINCKIHRY